VATRKRGGAIGGLLSVPTPLPDDDQAAVAPVEAVQTAQEAPAVMEGLPERKNAPAPTPEPVRTAEAPADARKGPPGTIRLNDTAGRTLWEAYLTAKATDPFLSYRQFASEVVAEGLSAREKRRSG
jgi:hypothetical protein